MFLLPSFTEFFVHDIGSNRNNGSIVLPGFTGFPIIRYAAIECMEMSNVDLIKLTDFHAAHEI